METDKDRSIAMYEQVGPAVRLMLVGAGGEMYSRQGKEKGAQNFTWEA